MFQAQFGLASDPKLNEKFGDIKDDAGVTGVSNTKGMVTFAKVGCQE